VRAVLLRYSPLLLVAAGWEAIPRLGLIDPDTLPPLSAVLRAWTALLRDGDLAVNGLSSLQNLTAGLVLAIVFGVALGILMAWYRPVEILVNPLVRVLYPLPRSALIPVMILWFGLGAGSKIAAVFLGCLLPVVIGAFNGARGVEHVLVWSALAAGAKPREVLWDVVVPAAMPEILAGIRNALALSFILLVAAEFLVSQRGMGYLISSFGEAGAYDAMFAGVLTVSAVGFLADRLYLALMGWALRWRG
jgi:NitT/TauT family transport system permease protein